MEKKLVVPQVKTELSADRGKLAEQSKQIAKDLWSGKLTINEQRALNQICLIYGLDPILKQVIMMGGNVYITGGGLKVIANKDKETAIDGLIVLPTTKQEREDYGCTINDPKEKEYQHLFKAILYKKGCVHEFIEWGEANFSNVKIYNADFKSIADMAKTRGVNRVIKNAYSIAFTSFEELGYSEEQAPVVDITPEPKEEKINGNTKPKEPNLVPRNTITDAQLNAIRTIFKDKQEELMEILGGLGLTLIDELTKEQASKIIGVAQKQ